MKIIIILLASMLLATLGAIGLISIFNGNFKALPLVLLSAFGLVLLTEVNT